MHRSIAILSIVAGLLTGAQALAADVVPNEVQMPGTQPNEVGNFESPNKCDNCHAGYNDLDPGAEPATGWRGGAMGNAGRDPVFWATLAVAEQDFDGVGDLCIRCHSAKGWYGGRSTPTDGSGLAASDENGIDCDTCHASTNTDNTGINPSTLDPLQGVMISPFTANCSDDPLDPTGTCQTANEGYYGSGMLSLFPEVNVKLGPFSDAEARHQWEQSAWHRDVDFCGTCHDVSNPVVGDLAPGNGTQHGEPLVVSSGGTLGGPITEKAAFNNPPYAYGIVERTFSEYKASPLSSTLVSDFNNLPDDLKVVGGSLEVTYQAALQAGTGGNYADNTPRYFSCQSCHMRPVGVNPDTGEAYPGCNKNGAPLRADLPRHDHTGGNYWFASMAQYQDDAGTLRLGGGLNSTQLLAMDLGAERASKHLREAASLSVTGNTVTVTNLTGHKLITGYPEGRRMWLRIEWHDDQDQIIRVDGEYGPLTVDLDGDGQVDDTVETILDLDGTNTEIYEAHYAMTQEWANTLLDKEYPPTLELAYDRVTGAVTHTLGSLAGMQNADDHVDTFHFALNNYVSKDNRIPPYQMSHAEAKRRNALPVPETRYARAGDIYEYADDVLLSPPIGAVHATIDLLYQGTSWEYIQFLQLANKGTNAFLGGQGDAMMDAWLNADVVKSTDDPITGVQMVNGDYKMVPPVVMASVDWGVPPVCDPTPGQETQETSCQDGVDNDCDGFIDSADSDCDTPPVCTYNDPSVSISPSALDIITNGGSVDYTVNIANNDTGTCANTIFNLSVSDTNGTNFVIPSILGQNSVTLASGANTEVTLTVTGQGGAPNGATNDTSVATAADGNHGGVTSNTVTTTINVGGQVDCSQFTTKQACNAEATCRWDNKNKVCVPN